MNKKHAYYAACFSLLFPGLGQLYLKDTVRGMCLFAAFILLLVVPTTRLLIPLVAVYAAWEAYRLAKKQLESVEETELSGGVVRKEIAFLKGQPNKSRLALYIFVAVVGFLSWFFVIFLMTSTSSIQGEMNARAEVLAAKLIRCSEGGLPSNLEKCLMTASGEKGVYRDFWDRDLQYQATEYGFKIRSLGADGKEETLDDYVYNFRLKTGGNNDPGSRAGALK